MHNIRTVHYFPKTNNIEKKNIFTYKTANVLFVYASKIEIILHSLYIDPMSIIKLFLIGIIIGIANVIPGVSGGTLIVVFNIYDKFMESITLNVKKLWANKAFLTPLLLGMVFGILVFSKLISYLYDNFPLQTFYVFTGLILGCIPLIAGYAWKTEPAGENESEKKSPARIAVLAVFFILGLAAILYFAYIKSRMGTSIPDTQEIPDFSPLLALKIFLAGLLAAVAMVIPGISGSLLLLILGVYTLILSSIGAFFVPDTMIKSALVLMPFALGVLSGILGGSRLISILLKKFKNQTYSVILGLIVGSLAVTFPGVGFESASQCVACILCLIAGTSLAFFGK